MDPENIVVLIETTYCSLSISTYELEWTHLRDDYYLPVNIQCKLQGLGQDVPDTKLEVYKGDELIKEFSSYTFNIMKYYVSKANKNNIELVVKDLLGKYVFTCKSYYAGKRYSENITINIKSSSRFLDVKLDQHLILGENGKITVNVISGTETPKINWYKLDSDGAPIPIKDDRYIIVNDGLKIKDVQHSDGGKFIVRIHTSSSIEINIQIYEKPELSLPSQSYASLEDDVFEFIFDIKGIPRPELSYYKDGIHIQNTGTNNRITFEQDNIIKFNPLKESDTGKYKFIAKNAAGEVALPIELVVYIKPKDIRLTIPVDIVTTPNQVNIKCSVRAVPNADLHFYHNDKREVIYSSKQSPDARISVYENDFNEINLIIKNTNYKDVGNYTCLARNSKGYSEKSILLKLNYKPVIEVKISTLWIYWKYPFAFHAEIKAYPLPKVVWKHHNSIVQANDTFHLYNRGNTYTLNATIPRNTMNFFGDYIVEATNEYGSARHELRFNLIKAPSSISYISVLRVTPNTILFKIKPPVFNNPEVPITAIGIVPVKNTNKVMQFRLNDKNEYLYDTNVIPNREERYYGLVYTKYEKSGPAKNTSILVTVPPVRKPYPMVLISSPKSGEFHSFMVTWDRIFTGGIPITKIILKTRKVKVTSQNGVWTTEKYLDEHWKVVELVHNINDKRKHKIELLDSNSYYELELTCVNTIGESLKNANFIFKTKLDKENDVTKVIIYGGEEESIDGSIKKSDKPNTDNTLMIVLIVVAILIFLIIADISCLFLNKFGVIHCCLASGKKDKTTGNTNSYRERIPLQQSL